jgi:hypothetical protein
MVQILPLDHAPEDKAKDVHHCTYVYNMDDLAELIFKTIA